jgi:hypothetical protein
MVRVSGRFRLDGRYEPLAAWPRGGPLPAIRAAAAAVAPSSPADPPRGHVTGPVVMAASLRCQHGCRRYLTAGPDNSRHLRAGLTAE